MLHVMDGGRASPLYRHPVRKAVEGYTVNRVYRISRYRAISSIPGIPGIPYTATIPIKEIDYTLYVRCLLRR